jgi:hypothetical protein
MPAVPAQVAKLLTAQDNRCRNKLIKGHSGHSARNAVDRHTFEDLEPSADGGSEDSSTPDDDAAFIRMQVQWHIEVAYGELSKRPRGIKKGVKWRKEDPNPDGDSVSDNHASIDCETAHPVRFMS